MVHLLNLRYGSRLRCSRGEVDVPGITGQQRYQVLNLVAGAFDVLAEELAVEHQDACNLGFSLKARAVLTICATQVASAPGRACSGRESIRADCCPNFPRFHKVKIDSARKLPSIVALLPI